MEIWVNPACSKCLAATHALDEAGPSYTVRRYLDEPPTPAELKDVLARLAPEPWHITRTNEAESIAVKNLPRTEEARGQWLQELVDHPRLIQRPIITADDGTTVIGRNNQSLAKVLGSEPTTLRWDVSSFRAGGARQSRLVTFSARAYASARQRCHKDELLSGRANDHFRGSDARAVLRLVSVGHLPPPRS